MSTYFASAVDMLTFVVSAVACAEGEGRPCGYTA